MIKQAVIIDFLGTIVDPVRLNFYPETIEALKELKKSFDMFISSRLGNAFIESHLERQNLKDIFYLIYGREDGKKQDHLDKILRLGDYEKVLYITNSLEELTIKDHRLIKVVVNVHKHELFPEDVMVFKEPLSVKIVEQIIEG
jgi:FMN phosphatase YigB (HAD superfamily)